VIYFTLIDWNRYVLVRQKEYIMGKIWEFFEEIDEIVYVADVETYEIVYMNRKAMREYGVESKEDYKGKKCYNILQNFAAPCYFCNNSRLCEGKFLEWEYENHILKQKFKLQDTLVVEDGRKYRMEMAFDITKRDRDESSYADNEAMINEGLRISLLTTNPDESIRNLLEYIGKSLNCERIYIFEDDHGITFKNTYEWCAPGVTPQIDNLQDCTYETLEIWLDAFRQNRNIIIKDLEEIKDTDPLMYDYLKPQDINSIVVSPLVYRNSIIGFYGVDNPPAVHLNNISTMFMIMGHFIVAQLRRIAMFKKMQRLSLFDQLTGLGNRHAVDVYMENLDTDDSIGIVYCDVMGLKRVNDKNGHKAGDELLLRACRCLEDEFGEYNLFRLGGDEFLVLCSGIDEHDLSTRVERLKLRMRKRDALMAVGSEWRPKSVGDIDELLMLADQRMYEDKRNYYELSRQ
jgi:diguanylate cyclase (GGDEF)-like protein